jgi:signal transduction histidine kinase
MKSDKAQRNFRGRAVYERMIDVFFYSKPIEDLKEIIHQDFMGYGTAEHEFVESRERMMEMARTQTEQLRNINIKIKRSPILEQFLADGTSCLIVEEFDMHNLTDGHRFLMRLSTILEWIGEKWQVTHFHASTPDSNVAEEESLPMEGLRRKNQELEAKIKERTRELEIEASLERVRAVAMGMMKPDDMLEVCLAISQESEKLGIKEIRNVQTVIVNEQKGTYVNYQYFTAYDQSTVEEVDYHKHPKVKEMALKMLSEADAFFSGSFEGEELEIFRNYRKQDHQFPDPLLDEATSVDYYFYSIGPGGLGLSTYKPLRDEELGVFKRFHKVFSLAYRRFLDIEKAEAQTREAQIEGSLERIRSRALAMRNSTEVGDVSDLLFAELEKMDINPTGFSIMVFDREQDKYELWRAKEVAHQGVYETFSIKAMYDKLDQHIRGFTEELESEWNGGSPFFIAEFSGLKRISFLEANREMGNYTKDQFENVLRIYPDPIFWHLIFFRYGWLGLIHNEQLPAEDLQVIRRFADVFEFAHTRFLDLQKAEAQAREAQIEGSLERVRSKTMAMRNSQDVGDTVAVMFDELVRLGIETVRCGIGILFESMQMETWTAKSSAEGKATLIIGRLGLNIHPLLQEVYHSWVNGDQSYSYELKGEDLKDYFRAINNSEDYPIQYDIDSLPSGQFQNAFFFSEGALFAFTAEPMKAEASMIFKRFAGVFGQTYTRFLDLQKAERQARESIKQSSLDRVRGQIASMRTAPDLENITPIIWKELKILDVPFIRCGVFFVDNDQSNVRVYLTTPDVKPLGVLNLPIESGALTSIAVDHWRKGLVYNEHWTRDQFVRWTQSMLELGQIQNKETYQGSENPPEALDLYFVPFTQGMLYLGNTSPLSEETIQLVKSLADAFSIAYARYEDFNKLEKVKESIETTLTELKATQAQLIQSEKMASLGELTAGVAHEIQNPLNFVNNFSEVSKELIVEMNDELAIGNWQLAKEIAGDIKQNLEKINHHGKRADAIVKGMLQHSRSSNGIKEPTDINALADEYLRLAYHGLRAKDKSFNATLKTDFNESIGKIDIIPQDIGRVILNLITNAFYAVNEKKKQAGEGYEPTVTVSTKVVILPLGGSTGVKISVKDNGNGIPQNILDKIFQPFFTTKPTGQGTGLGLSLAYDIVKAHGGELKVESIENEGTTFNLILPL